MNREIKLNKSIKINDREFNTITVKEPTTKDFLEIGLIIKLDKEGGNIDFKKVREYMLKADYPALLIDQLPPKVFIEYAGVLTSFFD